MLITKTWPRERPYGGHGTVVFDKAALIAKEDVSRVWTDAVSDILAFEGLTKDGAIRCLLLCEHADSALPGAMAPPDAFTIFAQCACDCRIRKFPAQLGEMGIQRGYVSWLMSAGTEADDLRIAVDHELLESVAADRVGFKMARILLHEIAHVKYHRDYAFQAGDYGVARCCKPEHEAIAWLYAAVVTGFALGQCSYDLRIKGPDTVWTLL